MRLTKLTINNNVLSNLILLRVLCESDMGLGIDAVRRDLAPFVSHKLSPGEWRAALDVHVGKLEASGDIEVGERRVLFPAEGARVGAEKFLGRTLVSKPVWADLKNYELIGFALGMDGITRAHLKALGGVGELRHAIVQGAYGFPFKRGQSAAALRNMLVGVALEKGFGSAFGKLAKGRASIPGATGRLVAAQLLGRPKVFANDAQIICQLASEHAGAQRANLPALRGALWRKMVEGPQETDKPLEKSPPDFSSDLKMFSDVVHIKAKERAKGWPGNRRAYISHVWNSIRDDCPELALDEGRFKGLLADAHRAGHLNLINADLRSRKNMDDLKASAVIYKNTEWHFIRVDE